MALLQLLHMKLAQRDKHQVHFKCLISSIAHIISSTAPCFHCPFNFSWSDTFSCGPCSNKVRPPSNGSPEKCLWPYTIVQLRLLAKIPIMLSLQFNYPLQTIRKSSQHKTNKQAKKQTSLKMKTYQYNYF